MTFRRLTNELLSIWLLLLGFVQFARADYAWFARSGHLHTKLGFDYFLSSENYSFDSVRENISFQNQPVDFSANSFWVESEYGIIEGVACSLRGTGWAGNLNVLEGGETIASGSGLQDIDASLKWRLFEQPVSTLELSLRVPTYPRIVAATDLVSGDGSVDFAVDLHLGFSKERFRWVLSPGLVGRSAGYPPQLRFKAAAEIRTAPAYFRLFAHSRLSLGYSQLLDSSDGEHDAPGSGGSYARLSGGPTGIDVGLQSGVELLHGYFVEGFVAHSVWGVRYPNAVTLGLTLHLVWDVNVPDTRIRIKEVPLDKAPTVESKS